MKPSDNEYDTKLNTNKTNITLDPIYLIKKDTTTKSDISDIRLASLQIREYLQSSDDDMTPSTFLIPQQTFNNNNTIFINPWQDMTVSSTQSQSKTKIIRKNIVDSVYPHNSNVLPSNHESTIKTNTNNSILWNRANNPRVRKKSKFINRLLELPRRQIINPNQQQSTTQDV